MTTHKYGGKAISATLELNLDMFKAFRKHAEKTFKERANALLEMINARVMIKTAVWEGETLINWNWNVGDVTPGHREPIPQPLDPGDTNNQKLGPENRRPANSIATVQSLGAITRLKTMPPIVTFTNTGEVAVDMEKGLVPGGLNQKIRARGMLRLTMRSASLFKG